jgi:HSP20 family protein
MSLLPFRNSVSTWREMERLRREMNRLFAGMPTSGGAAAPGYPAINVWTNEDGAVLTAELPGVSAGDIEGTTYHRRERGHGRFSRVFRLPFPIDSGKVEAAFEKGILHITLPRPESDKPRKIAIKAG